MKTCIAWLALFATVGAIAADKPDPWEPVRFMIGSWQGEAAGEPGKGQVERTYEWTLAGKFIKENNTSSYEARDGKPPEIHHHDGYISYDKARKTVMLRHFHEEGFVNLYALNKDASTRTRVVFDSVSFENFSNEWKARETYEIVSPDEFIETFELAEPGKEFAVYSRNHFKRKR
jgi:hypothetical protein